MNGFFFCLPWLLFAGAVLASFRLRRAYRTKLIEVQEQSREQLANAQTMLRRISQAVESTSDAVGIGDMEGNSLYHNHAHVQMFGYTVDELNAVPDAGVLFADRKVAQEILLTVKAGNSWRGETEIMTKAGDRISAFVRADIIRDEAAQPVGIYGVFADITERKRIDRLLEEERARLKVTLQSIGDGVITTDMGGCVVSMNPVAEKLSGRSQVSAGGCLLQEVLPLLDEPSRRPLENPMLRLVRSEGKTRRVQNAVLIMPDGKERFLIETTSFIRSGSAGAAGVVQVLHDVTDERKRAAEAARAGKLESLGLLAGGVAHDFNNLLMAMVGNVAMARMESDLSESLTRRLGEIDKIIWRARDLTQGLKTFAKGDTPRKQRTRLLDLIRETAALALQGTSTELELILQEDLLPVEADASQLGQVLHNIILNAAQAMALEGKLVIAATNLDENDDTLTRPALRWIKISITDNGPGISPEALPKIFDPFFTTKSQGTGLGLATSSSIVEGHGGRLRVESKLGQGTAFHIVLPVAVEQTRIEKEMPRRRILLLNGDRAANGVIESVLNRLGFVVTVVRTGREGGARFKEEREQNREFDAVLMDIETIGDAGGTHSIRQLRMMDARFTVVAFAPPGHPVLVDPKRHGFSAALIKPVKVEDLERLLDWAFPKIQA